MPEDKTEQIVIALRHYFDIARPDDDDYNESISRAYREKFGNFMLFWGPPVIFEGLRNTVVMQAIMGQDDTDANRTLVDIGIDLLLSYSSLVRSYGPDGIAALIPLGQMYDAVFNEVEPLVALTACTFGLLAEHEPFQFYSKAVVAALEYEFNYRRKTSCKVALAWALYRWGNNKPFFNFAIPAFVALGQDRRTLENKARSDSFVDFHYLTKLVLTTTILDIASMGRIFPEWK